MRDVDVKSSSCQYRVLDEFKADVQLIVHNIIIYHGGRLTLNKAYDLLLGVRYTTQLLIPI